MNNIEMFQELINATLKGDTEKIKQIVDTVTSDRDTTIIKCVNCGKIISFEKTNQLFMCAAGNIPDILNYRVLKHMKEDTDHNVVIPMGMGLNFPLSQMLEGRLRAHCKRGDKGVEVDYESWFPGYVERWRIKAGE